MVVNIIVLILVLVDHTLGAKKQFVFNLQDNVLILVLVDHTLGDYTEYW